jgi:hypothetical protein
MENNEDNLQQEIIDSLAKKVTNLEKRQDEMDKNDVTSISEKIKELEIKVSGVSETQTLENTKLLECFEKQLNGFDAKINAIPKEIPINHKLQFDTKSKLVIRVIVGLGLGVAVLLAISISLFIENGRKADETDKFLILKGFYPDIAIAIDSAYIDNPDTLVKKAQINIDKQQAMSEAALEAQQAAEQSKQANDKLKKLKSK